MCFILTVIFAVASYSFYSADMIPHAIISALLASIAISCFSYMIYKKRRCLFGKERDCNAV